MMSDKFILTDDARSELAQKYSALKELTVHDKAGNNYRVFTSQFSPLASSWRDNFECWEQELNSDIMPIIDLATPNNRKEEYISYHFIVPSYQRGYRWDEEMVSDLLSDIYTNYRKYYEKIKADDIPSEKTWYCIQPLVVKPSPDFLNAYFVIDGQQRLTTLAIFLYALRCLLPAGTSSVNAIISISYESRPESGNFLYNLADYCAEAVEVVKQNIKSYSTTKERVKATRDNIKQPSDLDSRYMLNTYLYAYWYFYERICEAEKAEEFFSFAKQGWKRGERLDPKCFALFENMILEQTSVIWYNIKTAATADDDHVIFENFNSGKIELTDAELVKGLFMNPDNYTEEQDEALNEKIKTRQIMIGGEWDEIERSLHNPHLWDFIPHLTAPENEDQYPATRIDAVLAMYVYFNLDKNERMKFDEEYFTFKIINKRIYDKLQNTRKKQGEDDKRDAFGTMLGFWNDIKRLYQVFLEWYNGDPSLPNMHSLYHRISLFRRLNLNTSDTYTRRYRIDLEEMKTVFKVFQSSPKSQRVDCINKIILDKLQADRTPDGIRKLVQTTKYDSGRNVEALLLAFNLATLEGAKGYGGRFPFFTYKDEQWEKEHIFATKTVLAGEGKEFLKTLTSDSETQAYKSYNSFIQGFDIDEANLDESAAGIVDFSDYETKIDTIKTILDNNDETINQQIEEILEPNNIAIDILTDDQMGNMALLPKRNNIIVSNDPFYTKAKKIKNMFKQGDFIPICTMNVFCDFYLDEDGVSDNRSRHWLYEKRIAYVKQMIESVSKYLSCTRTKDNE